MTNKHTIKTHSLLNERFISVRLSDESVAQMTLSEILAGLVGREIIAFEALQAHQQQAWYSFLVQVAAMAAARTKGGEIPESAAAWEKALLALSKGSEAAWRLVNDDLSEPAFMQPPVPEGSLDDANYKSDIPTPDQLDILITSKNHDVKAKRINRPRPEHWLYALCMLQTMEGYFGVGNYGIVRMNSGYGNRPMVGLSKGLSWGDRFRRDLNVLLDTREDLLNDYDDDGHALIWIEPWDGKKESAIPLKTCDPYFIEICRRIRFQEEGGQLVCRRANTKGQRIDAPDTLNGKTNDPWTPVEIKGAKALSVGENGFSYKLLQQILLSGNYENPSALQFREGERSGAYLIARTLVRGQGKTDGLHHRIIPINEKASSKLFASEDEKDKLAERARLRVDKAGDVYKRVLYPSIAALLSSGRDDRVDWDDVEPWMEAFDDAVDSFFFDELWDSVELSEEEAARRWEKRLLIEARKQFGSAKQGAPMASIHRWKALSKAQSVFEGQTRNILERAFDDNGKGGST